MHRLLGTWVALGVFLPCAAMAADDSVAGEVTSPFPTLHNLSVEWALEGDDNLNAGVTVAYRRVGDADFREGLPLFRVPAGSNEGFDWTNKFSGSVFGLASGTAYEIELTLTDPDGGDTTVMLEAATRAAPVVPDDGSESVVDPASLASALANAGPGDVLTLGEGVYGEVIVENDGEPGRPLVLRAASGEVPTIDGDLRIDGRSHVLIDGLVVEGMVKFNDAESITIQNSTIWANEDGIVSYGNGVNNAVIVNNVIVGRTTWTEAALGVDGDNVGEGVVLTGAGNVVAWNRVSGFRDCLSLLEDGEAQNQVSNDFYGNDLSECADDAIEADFAMGNVRVYQNRITDSFMGLSSQPSLGGPTYFIRNVLYNAVFQAFKLQRSSVGDVGLHNTVVKSGDAFSVNTSDVFSRAWFRNNLFIGGPGGQYLDYDSGPGDVIQLPSADESCSFDYDGYGSIGTMAFAGRIGETRFGSFDEMVNTTSEVHAVEVDLSAFQEPVEFPRDPFGAPDAPAFNLVEGAAALDVGIALPNVNDGFEGTAPDLGAIELGSEEPQYGPGGEQEVDNPEDQPPTGSGGTNGSGGQATGGSENAAAGTNAGGTDAGGSATSGGGETSEGGETNADDDPAAPNAGEGNGASGGRGNDAPEPTDSDGEGGDETTLDDDVNDDDDANPSADAGPIPNTDTSDDGGCNCRVGREGNVGHLAWWALWLAVPLLRRRTRGTSA